MYIDYGYYTNNGSNVNLDDATFRRVAFRCEKIIDRYTQGRIRKMSQIPEAVMHLMVELVTLEATQGGAVTENRAVSSFSNDGYSETYADPLTEEKIKEIESNLILEYLSGETDDNGTPLLWLGVE